MEKEGGNRERMRKCRESISLLFLIFSPFPPYFLILSPFPRSPAARLQRFVQPCCEVIFTFIFLAATFDHEIMIRKGRLALPPWASWSHSECKVTQCVKLHCVCVKSHTVCEIKILDWCRGQRGRLISAEQSITKYKKVLQSITSTNIAHLLGPIFGLVFSPFSFFVFDSVFLSLSLSEGMLDGGWDLPVDASIGFFDSNYHHLYIFVFIFVFDFQCLFLCLWLYLSFWLSFSLVVGSSRGRKQWVLWLQLSPTAPPSLPRNPNTWRCGNTLILDIIYIYN